MLWVKSLHIIFMVTWFSGLFYLPRLFVYHALATDETSITRFKIMERKLYFGILAPGAIFTLIFGIWLASYQWQAYFKMMWFHYKLTFVLILIGYHLYLGYLLKKFKYDRNTHSPLFYRILNEIPVVLLAAIVILVVVKPFSIV